MLSATSTETVRATLPAVRTAIGEITALFYNRMFAAHPELLRDLFNRGNQASGAQRQALAGAIVAFAASLVDQEGPGPDALLRRIAHKHASLGIAAEQYPIVHKHLTEAISQVLGLDADGAAMAAWDEVYWLMADALIALEARLYAEAGVTPGESWREYRVVDREQQAEQVVTFTVRPADGAPLPPAQPGQYVSVRVRLADGARQIRQYSLSGLPDGEALRFTVKRVGGDPAGEVSNHLHDTVRPGDTLLLGNPFGDVTLDDGDGPVLLASAGIGVTPIISMLDHLAATRSSREVVVVHADRCQSAHAFRVELEKHVADLPRASAHIWYERPEGLWPADRTGRADLAAVPIPADVTAYLCGPIPFMGAMRRQLLARGVPADAIHYEVFGPDSWLGQEPAAAGS